MMKNYNSIVLTLFLALSSQSHAHRDTGLRLDGDTLIGLPTEYTPAEFNWESKFLRVGEHQIRLRAFENIIPFQQEYSISIHSSWYHTRGTLPPYIGINLRPKERTFYYTILLNLDTLELISVTLRYRIESENHIKRVYHELKIRDNDLETIKRLTQRVK